MPSKYFTPLDIEKMNVYRQEIYSIRAKMYAEFGVDALDTDTLSSIAIYNIVKQYDSNYNINFARNGEDARSGEVLIEQKASKVNNNYYTSTGRVRKNLNSNYASFLFHAMGNINFQRYIFVARSSTNLSILRIYDISNEKNLGIVNDHLAQERKHWEEKNKKLGYTQKRDVININEKLILEKCNFTMQNIINDCKVYKD